MKNVNLHRYFLKKKLYLSTSSCQRSLLTPPINDALQTPPQCSGLISPIFQSDYYYIFLIIITFLIIFLIHEQLATVHCRILFYFKMVISISYKLSPNPFQIWILFTLGKKIFLKFIFSIEKTHHINLLVIDIFFNLVKIP